MKPGNILVARDGKVKLTDFDLVRAGDTTGGTRTGTTLGTFVYAPPEALEDGRDVNDEGDVYGLAMTAVFACYGKVLPAITFRDPGRIIDALKVPTGMKVVLKRGTAWERHGRYATIPVFCEELARSLVQEPQPDKPSWAEVPVLESEGWSVRYPDGKAWWLDAGPIRLEGLDAVYRLEKGCWIEEQGALDLLSGSFPRPRWASDWGLDEYGIYADFAIKGIRQRMRWIPPGRFLMGSPEDEPERLDRELQHEVILTRGYWLAETACTQAIWEAVTGKNPSGFKGRERPVESVSWKDVDAFIKQLNGLNRELTLRLPTEAEWEYACRAGTKTPFWFGENITPDLVNYRGDRPYYRGKIGGYRGETVEVKALPANGWGLYQMHGNVWEWCADWYGTYADIATVNPAGPREGENRVLRGGSWIILGRYVRSAYRNWNVPSYRNRYYGFRLARGQ